MDEQLRRTILLHIKERFAEKMFLSISHNLFEVAAYCKEIAVLGACNEAGRGVLLQGMDLHQDARRNAIPERKKLDEVMLEIMNAC